MCVCVCVCYDVGCKNDDSGGRHLCHLLAASAYLLCRSEPPAEHHLLPSYPPRLPCHLLVRYEQLHVQPYHVLLDERQVDWSACFHSTRWAKKVSLLTVAITLSTSNQLS